MESLSGDDAFFEVGEKGPKFGFGGGGDNVAEDTRRIKDCAVVDLGLVVVVAEVEMASNSASGFGFVEVTCITVDFEDHVAGVVSKGRIGMCVAIIQELA